MKFLTDSCHGIDSTHHTGFTECLPIIKVKKPFNKDFDCYYRIPFFKGFLKSLGKYKPDVIITEGFFQWTPMIILYSLFHKTPIYIGYERTIHTERFAPKFKIWHRKITDKFVKGYFVNGTETKEYLISLGIKEGKIHIGGMNADSCGLRLGIESISDEEKNRFKKKLLLNPNGITFLFSGQFIYRKGIIYLLNAWKEHILNYPNDSLILLGGGVLFKQYQKDFKEVKNIHFIGKLPYDEVYKFYAISDVFVMPTLEDNWCLVVPEAMSCGMPIACSKYNGGAIDLIKEGENGTIFDPLNNEDVKRCLAFFHGKDLKIMGYKSIEFEKPFNTENSATRVFNCIKNEY